MGRQLSRILLLSADHTLCELSGLSIHSYIITSAHKSAIIGSAANASKRFDSLFLLILSQFFHSQTPHVNTHITLTIFYYLQCIISFIPYAFCILKYNGLC